MKLLFWNVRHLGAGTDEDRKAALKTVFEGVDPDCALFCELTTTSTYPQYQNLTYRKENPHQLCYGALVPKGDGTLQDFIFPGIFPAYATDAYKAAGFKGGNDFTQLSDRAIASMGQIGPAKVNAYVFHAPGGAGQKAVAFAACSLNDHHKAKPWILLGDLNVEPSKLLASGVGINLGDLVRPTAEPTYLGKKRDKFYDYALSNFPVKVARLRKDPRFHGSDHYPIVIEW
jgi:hypothetical protein